MNEIKYQEAYTQSVEYFNGDELAAKIFLDKYALRDLKGNLLEKTPDEMHRRLAKEFARIEKDKFKKPLTEDQIFDLFDKFKYIIPQGSPMYGIGNPYQYVSIGNCFVIPSPLDSYLGIMYTDTQITQISCRRGGVGWDISLLRPAGAPVQNAAKSTSGAIEFAKRFSHTIREVGQLGRRGASLQSISCYHPSVKDFIKIKRDLVTLTGSNITVQFDDSFMKAVEKDEEVELKWPCNEEHAKILRREVGEIREKVKARDIWNEFVDSAWGFAEPGCCFIDTVHKDSPGVPYGHKETSSNPCGEQYLPPYASCRLMVLNLLSFVENPFTDKAKFNFVDFAEKVRLIQRLADDVVDLEIECIDRIIKKIKGDPEPDEIKRIGIELWKNVKKTALEDRRTGCGFTALGDTIAALGMKYISEESFKLIEKIQKQYALNAYRSSVDMAKELGAFPLFDVKKDIESGFIKKIKSVDSDLYNDMAKYGRRNMVLLTVAPTGSVSCLTQTSSGIEPVFMLSYMRRKKGNPGDENFKTDFIDDNGDHWQHFEVYHHGLKKWMGITGETKIEKSPYYKSTAMDLEWEKRVEMQGLIQKWVDNSISVTINLPNNVSKEVVSKVYFEAWKHNCKGVTVYRDGCRSGVLVNKETQPPNTKKSRPNKVKAEIFSSSIKKQKMYVAVGFIDDKPFEVFTGLNEDEISHGNGFIRKDGKGKYTFVYEDEKEFHLTNGHSDDNADALSRIISCSLRHGTPLVFIIEQLNKVEGDMFIFSKVIARILKKFVENGTKSTEKCPECSNNLTFVEGCKTCLNCGYAKCG